MPAPMTPHLDAQRVANGKQRQSSEPRPISSREALLQASRTSARNSISAAPEGSGSIGEQQKEPVLQLFVNPVGLPKRRGMRVVVESDDRQEDDEPLGATQRSDHQDPLFNDSIELWDQASGKDGSVQLRFLVKAWRDDVPDKEETLAIASIRSDELRRFGLYNPREGAAVALPLYTSSGEQLPLELGRHAEPAQLALHCYIYVGYSRRQSNAGEAQTAASATADPDAACCISHGTSAQTLTAPLLLGRQDSKLHVDYACVPAPHPLQFIVRVRAYNRCKARILRLGAVELRSPTRWAATALGSPPVDVTETDGRSEAHGGRAVRGGNCVLTQAVKGVLLPPGGVFHLAFLMRPADSDVGCGNVRAGAAGSASGTPSSHPSTTTQSVGISVVTPSTPVQAQSGDDSPQYEKTLLAELKLEYTSMAAGYLPGCVHVDDHSNGGSTAKATVASPAADANAASVDVSDDGNEATTAAAVAAAAAGTGPHATAPTRAAKVAAAAAGAEVAASARAAAAAAAATETAADVATEGAPEVAAAAAAAAAPAKAAANAAAKAAELRALDAVALATSAAAAATEAAKMAEAAAAADPVAKHAAFAATASATTAVKAAAKASELEKVALARLAQAKAAAAAKLVLERTLAPLHLDPPLVTHPVSILSHRFAALMPCVGVGVTLEMNLGWPSLVMRAAALGTRPCDGIWRTEVDVEWLVQVTIEQDDVWEVIGPSSQLVRLPITSIDSTAAMCQLKWKLVALRSGHLLLPQLSLLLHHTDPTKPEESRPGEQPKATATGPQGDGAEGISSASASDATNCAAPLVHQLPPPPYLQDDTVLVTDAPAAS